MDGPDLGSYDRIIVAFSGGKDSLACLLHLLDQDVPHTKLELWHHDVDGREGSDLMDWPVTRDYCAKVASALGVPIYYSWKRGGFEGEMLRQEQRTTSTHFEQPDGSVATVGGEAGKPGTRRKFPQVSADLSVRWCSAYLKIDIGSTAIRNQPRFRGKRTLVVTGERAQESPARAKYQVFEPDRADGRDTKHQRHVDHWRPIHAWDESDVWRIIERHRVQSHPAYHLGWGRVSCMTCIFGSPNQWASVKELAPAHFERIAEYEEEFGLTIQRKRSVRSLALVGQPYPMAASDRRAALSRTYDQPVILPAGEWTLPSGAFGESCGPT
jgi:3'-phosphoadenosine 5'-phosphosulfate sulfotransferase (PAPS reductase)/FAD synthetase